MSSQYEIMVNTSFIKCLVIRQMGANDWMPFFGPAPAHTVNTWAEYKRKQALHKLGLILYMWHKRGLNPYMEALPVWAELGNIYVYTPSYSFVNVLIPW